MWSEKLKCEFQDGPWGLASHPAQCHEQVSPHQLRRGKQHPCNITGVGGRGPPLLDTAPLTELGKTALRDLSRLSCTAHFLKINSDGNSSVHHRKRLTVENKPKCK